MGKAPYSMKKSSDKKKDLRIKAEDKVTSLRERDLLRYLPQYDEKSLLHELQVHQVELEMQNEEMRDAQAQIEETKNRYRELYDFAPVGYLTLDGTGMILEANLRAAALLNVPRAALIYQYFQSFMDREGADGFHLFLRKPMTPGMKETVECSIQPRGASPFEAVLHVSGEYGQSSILVRYRVVLFDVSKLKLLEQQERETGDRLRSLASELNLSEELTRKALAGTLHDKVCQTLAAARMKLSSARSFPKETALEKIIDDVLEMLAAAITETRSLMVEISPPVLHDLGLEAAIDWMAERMSSAHGIAIKTLKRGDLSGLEQDLKIMLYQTIRELMVNVVKHSGARHASVTLECDKQGIAITVTDDGNGFVAGEHSVGPESGFGLFSIRERLKSYNGHLQIESQIGQGTTASIRLPMGNKRK